MVEPLNGWLDSTIKKAKRVCEDSDRKTRASALFVETIKRVNRLATEGAIRTPIPAVERFQNDEMVLLAVEWFDRSASWHLYVGVRRQLGEKPEVVIDFSGTESYATSKPTDADIGKALHDYFEAWKKG